MNNFWQKLFCFLNIHSWYYGDFQTGKISVWTGDYVGVRGRVCLDCDERQIRKEGKYELVESFRK